MTFRHIRHIGSTNAPRLIELQPLRAKPVVRTRGTYGVCAAGATWGEFKWNGVDPRFLEAYQGFLDLTLALPDLRFTSIVIDTDLFTQREMTTFHKAGGRQEAYLKFMRLLLKQRIDGLVQLGHREFTLLYDRLSSVKRELAADFRSVLMRDMEDVAVRRRVKCEFVHLSSVNSATVHLVQAADLLTGATRSAWAKRAEHGR